MCSIKHPLAVTAFALFTVLLVIGVILLYELYRAFSDHSSSQ
jgi:hypothetical protein